MDPSPGMYSRALGKAVPKTYIQKLYLVRSCKGDGGVQINPSGFQVVQVRHCSSLIFTDRTDTVTRDCTTLFRKQSDIVRRNSVFVDKIVNPAEKRFLTIKLNKWSYLAKDSLSPEQIVYCRFPLGEFLPLNTTQTIREETRSAQEQELAHCFRQLVVDDYTELRRPLPRHSAVAPTYRSPWQLYNIRDSRIEGDIETTHYDVIICLLEDQAAQHSGLVFAPRSYMAAFKCRNGFTDCVWIKLDSVNIGRWNQLNDPF